MARRIRQRLSHRPDGVQQRGRHIIWFTNGSSTQIQEDCQNLLIPVEKIDKQNPAGQTTAAIGVPFTYTLTMPVLFDPATGTVINNFGSPNDLHSIRLTDNLNETGADLTYVSHVAYWESSGAPVAHTFSNIGGLLTFENFPIVPAGEQIIIELTVVLDASPANVVGTQFINTGKWEFGRLIDGVFYNPLPGEWGITPPLTIAAPELVFTKTGPATLNLGRRESSRSIYRTVARRMPGTRRSLIGSRMVPVVACATRHRACRAPRSSRPTV